MNRKKIIGIIGDAHLKGNQQKAKIASEIGKLIIDYGFRLANGGYGGVMECASQGAHTSEKYSDGLVLGILPEYDDSQSNPYIDIPIATGLGPVRNYTLISMCDAIIAIGGGAGTLNEIAIAWQMEKLIVAIDIDGWSQRLMDQSLDNRRNDKIFSAKNAQEALSIVINNLDRKAQYHGIKKSRLEINKAHELLSKQYTICGEITFLGQDSEGMVFRDDHMVYKIIDNNQDPLCLFWLLQKLSQDIKKENTTVLYPFDVAYNHPFIFISYKYEKSESYSGGEEKALISLMKELKKIGWVLTDFKPKNIRVVKTENLTKIVISDIGHSFLPYIDDLYRKMLRKVYVSMVLAHVDNLQLALSETNNSEEFSQLKQFGLDPQEAKKNFIHFFEKANATNKEELLNPIIKKIIIKRIEIKTLFDYGSGHGDIAKMILGLGIKVTAYDIDLSLYVKYPENYKQIISLDQQGMKAMINSGKTFDCVLCSLVLCHLLAETKEQRDIIIDEIMEDITKLSNKYVIITICNPLYTNVTDSNLQIKHLDSTFRYSDEIIFEKTLRNSQTIRKDIHRPLSYYEQLFCKHRLKILEIHQSSGDNLVNPEFFYSDFMCFLLRSEKDQL